MTIKQQIYEKGYWIERYGKKHWRLHALDNEKVITCATLECGLTAINLLEKCKNITWKI